MKDLLYRALGRASLSLDPLRAGMERSGPGLPGRDGTGLHVTTAEPLTILRDDGDVLFVRYDSLAHSLWRAQELSLFRNHATLLQAPLLDFGTGDGSFTAVLRHQMDYGVDSDPEALRRAAGYRIYRQLLVATDCEIPLPAGAVRTVLSNSVLEHVENLDVALTELRRVLDPQGLLVFTVPTSGYARHLTKYFGQAASSRINYESAHRHLLAPHEWRDVLHRHGFQVRTLHEYQPDWFTFWYRMCRLAGPRGLGRFVADAWRLTWPRLGTRLVQMVRRSIAGTDDGANIFVVAGKSP